MNTVDKTKEKSLYTISIENTGYSLSQNKYESVKDFKIRLQGYLDKNNVNIKVV